MSRCVSVNGGSILGAPPRSELWHTSNNVIRPNRTATKKAHETRDQARDCGFESAKFALSAYLTSYLARERRNSEEEEAERGEERKIQAINFSKIQNENFLEPEIYPAVPWIAFLGSRIRKGKRQMKKKRTERLVVNGKRRRRRRRCFDER